MFKTLRSTLKTKTGMTGVGLLAAGILSAFGIDLPGIGHVDAATSIVGGLLTIFGRDALTKLGK